MPNRSGSRIDVVPSPYLLHHNNRATYDCSRFVEPLGAQFVEAACVEVRRHKDGAEIAERTWLENYAGILEVLLDELTLFCREDRIHGGAANISSRQWLEFGSWISDRLERSPRADRTIEKQHGVMNHLLSILAAARVLPVVVKMTPRKEPKIAGHGESRFTVRGSLWKAKPVLAPSHFRFSVRGRGRQYDYEPYRSLGAEFLLCVVPALTVLYGRHETSRRKHLHDAATSFFGFLLTERECGHYSSFFSVLEGPSHGTIDGFDWETVLYAWRDEQRSSTERLERKLVTAGNTVLAVNTIWQHLSEMGVVPEVDLISFKNACRRSEHTPRRTLAQLTKKSEDGNLKVDHSGFQSVLGQFDKADRGQAREFVNALCQELSPDEVRRLSPQALAQEIHKLNASRLEILRACAEAEFLEWFEHWKHGEAALQLARPTRDEIVGMLDSPLLSVRTKRMNSARLLTQDRSDATLGNVLTYMLATQNGVISGLWGRYHHISRHFGGRPLLHAYLHPHALATAALWVLLMIDSGANCEVIREMPFACLHPSRELGFRCLQFGDKARAGGKAIFDSLPEKTRPGERLSSVVAIERYQEMSGRYRKLARPKVAEKLFLHESRGQIQVLPEWTAREWFTAFVEKHDELRGLNVRPSYLRPSVLLDVQHKSPEGVLAAQNIADHPSPTTTTTHYTGRVPAKLILAGKTREFQDRYQAVVVASIDRAAAKLGMSSNEFERVLSDAVRTGLGVALLDATVMSQSDSSVGAVHDRDDGDRQISMSWVIGTVENIADLILFNEHLGKMQTHFHGERPGEWERRWLPWLVFTDIAIAKLSQGETAAKYVEAKSLANVRRESYKPIPLI